MVVLCFSCHQKTLSAVLFLYFTCVPCVVPEAGYRDSLWTPMAAVLSERVCFGGVDVTFHLCSISRKSVLTV